MKNLPFTKEEYKQQLQSALKPVSDPKKALQSLLGVVQKKEQPLGET